MVTDEQRHEVAERLRGAALHDKRLGSVLFPYLISDLVGAEHKMNMVENDAALLNKLADLIEPSEPVVFQCAHCGDVWHKQPTYCPCCGKKVE